MNALRRKTLARLLDGIEGKLDALLEVIEDEQESMADYIENLRELFHIEF